VPNVEGKRYLLQHFDHAAGLSRSRWTRSFATLAEAREAADSAWTGANQPSTQQFISDALMYRQSHRRLDGSWSPLQ
jgi:hypothetical protein